MKRVIKEIIVDKKLIFLSLVMGILIGFFVSCGYELEKYGNVYFEEGFTYLLFAGTFVFAWFLSMLCMKICEKCNFITNKQMKRKPIVVYCIVAVALFLIWFPQLLGVYPGYFNYDATGQWEMYNSGMVTAHHPVLHTMLLGWIVDVVMNITGSFNKGVFCFLLVQMFLNALCFAYVLTWMYRKRLAKWLMVLSFIWFAVFPTVIINICSVTKDSLFSAFFIVFIVMTAELLENTQLCVKSLKFMTGWCLISFLTIIMRNNTIYVMVLFMPILLWKLRSSWKKMLPAIGILFGLYVFYAGIICPAVTVQGVSSREFISVPAQQMMRVYQEKKDELSEEEIVTYETLFDEVAIEYYLPKISDVVKARFNIDEFNSDKKKYIGFYVEQGMKWPEVYINSFLHNTYGFWYPMSNLALDIHGNEGYFVCKSLPPATNNSIIPFIFEYYQLFEKSSLVYGNSPLMVVFAPASYFWLFVLVFIYSLWKRKMNVVWALLPVLLIWLTFLLGPVALVRYVSFLFYLVPVELTFLFGESRRETNA